MTQHGYKKFQNWEGRSLNSAETICGLNLYDGYFRTDVSVKDIYREPHKITCAACLAGSPRLFATEGGGYAIEEPDSGLLVFVKNPNLGDLQSVKFVPEGMKIIQVSGPVKKEEPLYSMAHRA